MHSKSSLKPLRVLLTTPNLDTAGSKYVLANLIKGIDRSIVHPSLCVHRLTHTQLENELRDQVDTLLEIPLRVPTRPLLTYPLRTYRLARQLRGKFDIIHSFDYASSFSEGIIARQAGIPWIMTKTNLSWGRKRWWLRSLLATKIVLYSQAQFNQLYEGTRFACKSIVINIGVDIDIFSNSKSNKEKNLVRDDIFDIPYHGVALGCVAYLVPVKGHRELLHAFAEIRKQHSSVYLVLIGGGETSYEMELRQLAEKLKITPYIRFLGTRQDVPRLLPALDGIILATRNWGRKEAFGAALVEAMACGLPAIATKSGGPEDIVVPGKTGWLVSAKGIEPLVNAMMEFFADRERRYRYGQAGKKRVHQLFSKELMIKKYQELYTSVI